MCRLDESKDAQCWFIWFSRLGIVFSFSGKYNSSRRRDGILCMPKVSKDPPRNGLFNAIILLLRRQAHELIASSQLKSWRLRFSASFCLKIIFKRSTSTFYMQLQSNSHTMTWVFFRFFQDYYSAHWYK